MVAKQTEASVIIIQSRQPSLVSSRLIQWWSSVWQNFHSTFHLLDFLPQYSIISTYIKRQMMLAKQTEANVIIYTYQASDDVIKTNRSKCGSFIIIQGLQLSLVSTLLIQWWSSVWLNFPCQLLTLNFRPISCTSYLHTLKKQLAQEVSSSSQNCPYKFNYFPEQLSAFKIAFYWGI